jgi:biotin synthase
MDLSEVTKIFQQDLTTLVEISHEIHINNFPSRTIQASSLLSLKTGGCPENCSYCPQSAHYKTKVEAGKLLNKSIVQEEALKAKSMGATRFCMGAAWREVKDGPDFNSVLEMVSLVKESGLEVCCTLGMLNETQAHRLKQAGLDAYNHNIDTSKEYYSKIIQTRTFDDRLRTIQNVTNAGIAVCTGGILGLGETEEDRISFIHQLASFTPHPESITVNTLIPFEGTPLSNQMSISPLDILKVIATIRIVIPNAKIRLSAGRLQMDDSTQFLCFYAGANSIFLGEKLLTSANPDISSDYELIKKFGYSFTEKSSANIS